MLVKTLLFYLYTKLGYHFLVQNLSRDRGGNIRAWGLAPVAPFWFVCFSFLFFLSPSLGSLSCKGLMNKVFSRVRILKRICIDKIYL